MFTLVSLFIFVFHSLAILETESALTGNRALLHELRDARQNAVIKLPLSPYTRVFSAREERSSSTLAVFFISCPSSKAWPLFAAQYHCFSTPMHQGIGWWHPQSCLPFPVAYKSIKKKLIGVGPTASKGGFNEGGRGWQTTRSKIDLFRNSPKQSSIKVSLSKQSRCTLFPIQV